MKLIQRFGFYLGGFGIGIVFVIFFLSGKNASCSYFPNARVLKEIRFKTQKITPEVRQFFAQNNIDTLVVAKLLQQGSVDFSASQTDRDKPCRIYVIKGTYQQKNIQIKVKECKATDTLAIISNARFYTPKE